MTCKQESAPPESKSDSGFIIAWLNGVSLLIDHDRVLEQLKRIESSATFKRVRRDPRNCCVS